MLSRALEYTDLGLAVFGLPPASKRPAGRWRQWQRAQPSPSELAAMFGDGPANLAAVCGAVSGNLIGLDCDDAPTFAEVGAKLARLGISTWTVQRPPNGSPHDGGGLILLRGPEPVRTTKAGSLDVRGEGSYCLLPDSQHPGGGLYQFIAGGPPSPLFAIPDLRSPDFSWLPLKAWQPPPADVPRLAWRLLTGDAKTAARYATRSEQEAAICAALQRAGLQYGDAMRLLLAHDQPGKFKALHAKDPADGRRYLWLTWCEVAEWLRTHPSPVKARAQALRVWATSRPWPGRSGPSSRACYLAHLDLAERAAKQPHGASARELAEIAGLSWKTANKANHRLVKAGLLQLADKATATLSHRWTLPDPPAEGVGDAPPGVCPLEWTKVHTPSTTPVMECDLLSTPSGEGTAHDLWRWGGLNKSGAEVWAVLQAQGEATERELVKMTGRCRRTVKRRLLDMFKLGMAEPLGDGLWRALEGADLDQAAREVGTWGKGAKQRERHREDRAVHRLTLERGKARKRSKGGGWTLGQVRKVAEPAPVRG